MDAIEDPMMKINCEIRFIGSDLLILNYIVNYFIFNFIYVFNKFSIYIYIKSFRQMGSKSIHSHLFTL